MNLLGLVVLDKFKEKHAAVRGSLGAWQKCIEAAQWKNSQDIKNEYPSASFLAENKVIFNIKGNSYRLVVKVKYVNKVVLVEWVGTHAEYDKQEF